MKKHATGKCGHFETVEHIYLQCLKYHEEGLLLKEALHRNRT